VPHYAREFRALDKLVLSVPTAGDEIERDAVRKFTSATVQYGADDVRGLPIVVQIVGTCLKGEKGP